MARPLAEPGKRSERADALAGDSQRLDRNAAGAFAAAISALLVASLVISQSAGAFDPEGTVAANSLVAGTVSLEINTTTEAINEQLVFDDDEVDNDGDGEIDEEGDTEVLDLPAGPFQRLSGSLDLVVTSAPFPGLNFVLTGDFVFE